jgi:hypothetical protein
MAVTTALVHATKTELVYAFTHDGAAGDAATLTTTGLGAAGTDLRTDQVGGIMNVIAQANATGLGNIAAGAFTQALARALYQSQDAAAALGQNNVPRCEMYFVPQSGLNDWSVDCNVAATEPTITMTKATTAAAVVLLYIRAQHTEIDD